MLNQIYITIVYMTFIGVTAAIATEQEPRAFSDLPEAIQRQIGQGPPRDSMQIEASPFGTHTTIMGEGGSAEYIHQAPDLIAKAGYKWVMDYISIRSTEGMTVEDVANKFSHLPQRCFDFAQALKDRDIGLMVRLDPFPWTPWKEGTHPVFAEQSETLDKAKVFTREVVRQLKPYTRYWQIWNEPNIGNENPYILPADYVQVVRELAKVIREEQPDAVIMGPGTAMLQCLADTPYPWIPKALDAGLLDTIDVFTFHPYRQPAVQENIPEHASEFHPWTIWGGYEEQIADLRTRLRKHTSDGEDFPIASTEDGSHNTINGEGEQEITWVIGAKYELRRSLLDFYLNVSPRIQFCFYRPIGEKYYNKQSTFNLLTDDMQPKPTYYAVQNLHALLDSSYERDDTVDVELDFSGAAKPTGNCVIQTYYTDRGDFEELLIFFWSAEPSDDRHARYPATLTLTDMGWEGPMLYDLMAMPVKRPKNEIIEHARSDYVDRAGPRELVPEVSEGRLILSGIEVRDYPQAIKLIRLVE